MEVKDKTGEVFYWLSILEYVVAERGDMIIPKKMIGLRR